MLPICFRVAKSRTTILLKPSAFRTTLSAVRSISEEPRYFPTITGEAVEVNVGIVHFGVGRFHRAHQAMYIDEILQKGGHKWGICGVCMLPQDEKIYNALKEQNGMYNVIQRIISTTYVKKVSSLVEVLWGHKYPEDVLYTLGRGSVKIVTITVSEAGYYYHPANNTLNFSHEDLLHDLELYRASIIHYCCPTPESGIPSALQPNPRTIFGYLSIGMLHRYLNKVKPFTVLCCDDIQGNGDLIRSLLIEFCEKVKKTELKKPGVYSRFLRWLNTSVAFPNSIVDRITPVFSEEEIDFLRYPLKDFLDFVPVSCEMYRQWTIEDNFCNIKPRFEKLENVSLVPDIKPYENIKFRCLNGGYTALGYAGYLAGFKTILETVQNETFEQFLQLYFQEVSVTLDNDVEGMELSHYQEELLERFLNHNIEIDLLRVCKDGSSKIPGYVLPVVVEILEKNMKAETETEVSSRCLSFVVASWITFIEKQRVEGISLDDGEGVALFSLVKGMCVSRSREEEEGVILEEEGEDIIAVDVAKDLDVYVDVDHVDVGVFLREQRLFGQVGQNAVFVSQVQAAYNRIAEEGVLQAMQEVVGERRARCQQE